VRHVPQVIAVHVACLLGAVAAAFVDRHRRRESAAATDLLQLLESTELLRDVRFQAPVARSDGAGKEQFTIVAKLARSAP
jgi:hypothetical protein